MTIVERANQRIEIPSRVILRYFSVEDDYNIATQRALRESTPSEHELIIDTNLVLTQVEAASKAQTILDNVQIESEGEQQFSLTIKDSDLIPSDVIQITMNSGFVLTLRIVQVDHRLDGSITIKAVTERQAVYTNPNQGTPVSTPTVVSQPEVISPTSLFLLDIPNLVDEDNIPGLYSIASSVGQLYQGTVVFRSLDAGATFTEYYAQNQNSVAGRAATVLEDAPAGFTDYTNTVDVFVNAPLVSVTREQILKGENAFILGGEIIQVQNVTQIAGNRWQLDTFLRGRKRTPTTGHSTNELFASIDLIKFTNASLAFRGQELLYKAVSNGDSISNVDEIPFTNTYKTVTPFAVINVTGNRINPLNDDITITWTGLGALGSGWRVSHSASFLHYEIVVLGADSQTIINTFTVTDPFFVYTEIQQAVDFGEVRDAYRFLISQVNGFIGRGEQFILRFNDV